MLTRLAVSSAYSAEPFLLCKKALLVYYVSLLGLKERERGQEDKWFRVGQAAAMEGVTC